MKLSHVLLSLSLVLSAASASAQNVAGTNAPNASPAAPRVAPVPAQVSGNVSRFIVGPMGRVRGFQLQNGSVVMVHGRDAESLTQRVQVGQPVRVEGMTVPGAATQVIRRATVRAADGSVLVAAPAMRQGAPGERAAGVHGRRGGRIAMRNPGVRGRRAAMAAQRVQSMPAHTVSGTVQSVLGGPRGGVRALLLSNNATVYVSRGMHQALRQRGVRVGETVRASGHGGAYPQGTSVVADQLTFGDGATVRAAAPAQKR